MGRVAKYKKIKSFDPFSKANKKNQGSRLGNGDVIWGLGDNGRKVKQRSRTAERLYVKKNKQNKNHHQQQQQQHNRLSGVDGNKNKAKDDRNGGFDLPPTSQQDEFDLADLMGSVTKEVVTEVMSLNDEPSAAASTVATTTSSLSNAVPNKNLETTKVFPETTNSAVNNKTNVDDETKVARLLKLDRQVVLSPNPSLTSSSLHRLPGESKRAYQKRTRLETRQIIHQTTRNLKRNAEKVQKKKEFLNQKKKHKKKLGQFQYDDENEKDGTLDVISTGRRGDIPGGRNDDTVRFGEQAERPPTFRQLPRGAKPNKNNTKLQHVLPSQIGQQQQQHDISSATTRTTATAAEMELLRRKVQAQYASVRAKRRQVGEGFHL
jgi:hypothetical protein